jgi:hypothetical protein
VKLAESGKLENRVDKEDMRKIKKGRLKKKKKRVKVKH